MTRSFSVADELADHLGHVRARIAHLSELEAHLVAAVDIAHRELPDPQPGEQEPADPLEHPAPPPSPAATEPPTPPAESDSKYDLAEVAGLALDAIEAGAPIGRFVFEHLEQCPSEQMGSWLVRQARNAGHDIPKQRGGPRTRKTSPTPTSAAPAGKVFACTDCPDVFDAVKDIARHTRLQHGREAARIERTPTDRVAP